MPADDDQARWAAADGSTPLEPDEAAGLIPAWIATRGDLNTAEQENILRGLARSRWRHIGLTDLLDDLAARALHKDMFGEVWRWAGSYRSTELNIGVDPRTVSVRVRDLMEDAKLWIGGRERLPPDAVGCRFHHRLVEIHPFPNGNGRHSRVMTDFLMRAMSEPPFTWGRSTLDNPTSTRAAYGAALRAADNNDFTLLEKFVRS